MTLPTARDMQDFDLPAPLARYTLIGALMLIVLQVVALFVLVL